MRQETAPLAGHPLYLLIAQLRPRQWTKNLLVFAALIFSFHGANLWMLMRSVIGFLLFCFVSGCVYILNDFVDREADRQHPEKRHRPMASGALNPYLAMVFGLLLLVGSLTVAWYFKPTFGGVLLLYFAINVAYSLRLKQVVIVDVMLIASGFVLRALGGGLIINVPFTSWFLLCTMLLALFFAISKRRHELALLKKRGSLHRSVLEHYSPQLLDQLNAIVVTATIMSYALFTFTSGHTIVLMWTIPLVIYGIFRYLYLIHMEEKGGAPERDLFGDKHILGTVVLYALSVILILKFYEW